MAASWNALGNLHWHESTMAALTHVCALLKPSEAIGATGAGAEESARILHVRGRDQTQPDYTKTGSGSLVFEPITQKPTRVHIITCLLFSLTRHTRPQPVSPNPSSAILFDTQKRWPMYVNVELGPRPQVVVVCTTTTIPRSTTKCVAMQNICRPPQSCSDLYYSTPRAWGW